MKDFPFRVYLGTTKHWGHNNEKIYLTGFKWDCNWYYGGGYLESKSMHTHFNNCFLETIDTRGHSLGNFCDPWYVKEGYTIIRNGCSVWEDLDVFLNDAQFNSKEWWRIKDLYKQFYTLREIASCFQYGGHCTSKGRDPLEIDKSVANRVNLQIQDVIIPQIMKALRLEVQ